MPRQPKSWYRGATGWWMAQVDRKREKLVEGPETEAFRKKAMARLGEIIRPKELNAAPEKGRQTVAAVIDLYLEHAKARYAERSLHERKLILQAFTEADEFRRVNDADRLAFHLTRFVSANTRWKSDWTKAQVIAVVHRRFKCAAKQRLIVTNPFRGVSQRACEPRRPMTDKEFAKLVSSAEGRKTKKRPYSVRDSSST